MPHPAGPYDWKSGEEFETVKKDDDPFKGECRSCGASLENCHCWDHYKE